MIIQTATFSPQMRNIEGNVEENKWATMNEKAKDGWKGPEEPTRQRGRERDRDGHVFISLNLTLCPKTSRRNKHELHQKSERTLKKKYVL